MKIRRFVFTGLALLFSSTLFASTGLLSSAITSATNPATTSVPLGFPNNQVLESSA
ncbi:MAG: hypothetical protein ABJC61_06960 [Acidobacteriota bacterium]